MKKTAAKFLLPILIVLGALALMGLRNDGNAAAKDKNFYKDIKTFNEVLDMVRKNYVDEVDTTR